jgi:hypothetical protein
MLCNTLERGMHLLKEEEEEEEEEELRVLFLFV